MATPPTTLSRSTILDWATALYAGAVDHKDAAGFAAVFAPDGWIRFGNAPVIVGPAAIETAIAQFFGAFVSLRHEAKGTFLDGDTLILEAEVTYTRYDDQVVTIPAVTIFGLAASGDRPVARDCRIYVDLTPLFAPSV